MVTTSSLRHSEITRHIEMLDALFKHATEGIVVVNHEGVIVMSNPKALELFGYCNDELVGRDIEILIPQRHSRTHMQDRNAYFESPKARGMGGSLDLFASRKDGSEFPVEISLSPFKTSEGEFVVSFVIDITDRKRNENIIKEANYEIQKLNAELERRVNQRTEELATAIRKVQQSQEEVMRALKKERELNNMKSQFVTIASHEFRTPLATILSSASLIGRYAKTEEQDKRQKHVQRIKSGVTNLTEILNDFLSIGKLEEGRIRLVPVRVDLSRFTQELLDEIRGLCKDGQCFDFCHDLKSDTWIDTQLLRNILFNLLSNAIKYSESGTTITLKIRSDTESIEIEIQDQGIGIPERDHSHIFERFFRAHNAGNAQGTGLGLNIVQNYVALMKGQISFSSQVGKGTTFYLSLPNYLPEKESQDSIQPSETQF